VFPEVFERIRELTEQSLNRLQPIFERRVSSGKIRDTHGDLRLDHVYLFPDKSPPEDVVILDCIEFNERFRFADPIADMAFLVMDLKYHGRRDLAQLFSEAYLDAAGEEDGKELVPFYTAYRAVVRAKVEGMKAAESEVPDSEKQTAVSQAKAHWLLALAELEQPGKRPCLILIGGPPGAGKSTLSQALAREANFEVLRTDVIRKELADIDENPESGIYTPEWNERTYAECGRRAQELLFRGRRVIIDASFREEANRKRYFQLAEKCGVSSLLFMCRVSPEIARERIQQRKNDASDADWEVFQKALRSWESASPDTMRATREILTDGSRQEALEQSLRILREHELFAKSLKS